MHFFVHFLLLSNSILFNNTLFTLSLLVQLSALYAYQGWKNRWGCKTQVFHSRLFDTTSVKRLGHRRTRMEGDGWGKKIRKLYKYLRHLKTMFTLQWQLGHCILQIRVCANALCTSYIAFLFTLCDIGFRSHFFLLCVIASTAWNFLCAPSTDGSISSCQFKMHIW